MRKQILALDPCTAGKLMAVPKQSSSYSFMNGEKELLEIV